MAHDARRKPFPFEKLPPEMQTHVAEMLDLDTLKHLTSSGKATRANLLGSLFKSVSIPLNHYPEVPYPLDALALVQSVNLYVSIYGDLDNDSWTYAISLLLAMSKLRDIHLTTRQMHLDEEGLARSLPALARLMSAISTFAQRATLHLELRKDVDQDDDIARAIAAQVLVPLRGFRFASLSTALDLAFDEHYDYERCSAYRALRAIAPSITHLNLYRDFWISAAPDTLQLSALTHLIIDNGTGARDAYEIGSRAAKGTVAMLGCCAGSLARLEIWQYGYLDAVRLGDLQDPRVSFEFPVLRSIELEEATFSWFCPVFSRLPACTYLAIDCDTEEDWSTLLALLEDYLRAPLLARLKISSRADADTIAGRLDSRAEALAAARERSIDVELHIYDFEWPHTSAQIRAFLADNSADICSYSISSPWWRPHLEHLEALVNPSNLVMPRCKTIRLVLQRDFVGDAEEAHQNLVSALLSNFKAPMLEELDFAFDSSPEVWAPYIISGLRANSFPSLQRIVGGYRSGSYALLASISSQTSWKEDLLSECETRSIEINRRQWGLSA